MEFTITDVELLLDRGELQMLGHKGNWYDLRRNGATKRWKRDLGRAEIPVKCGFKEAFRIEFRDNAPTLYTNKIRGRPADFDPRKRHL